MTNIHDPNQTGNTSNQWLWGQGKDQYTCAMSHSGSIVTAICHPYQQDITNKTTKIVSISVSGSPCTSFGYSSPCSQVQVSYGERMDPFLCVSGVPSTCVANGQDVIVSNHAGWNGSFAMTNTTAPFAADGTGGHDIFYVDASNNPGNATLCDNSGTPRCTGTGGVLSPNDVTYASLGFKMTDILIGDGVYADNVGGGDTTCQTNGYQVGLGSATYAISGTLPTGLTVVYQAPSTPSGTATCIINNGAGFPKLITLMSNTIFCPTVCSVQTENSYQQSINNQFLSNVWADNDSGSNSDVNCLAETSEGTLSFNCWDYNLHSDGSPPTFELYHNVLTGRNGMNWSTSDPTGLCPGCLNYFPSSGLSGTGAGTGVNCNTSVTSGCLGLVGFFGSSPTVSFPTGACVYDGSDPFDCPLMALPWKASNPLSLSDFNYCAGGSNCNFGTSSFSSYGVNTTQVNNAMTQTEYSCPTNAYCGTPGPFPD
jgi:hypothetical protein